MLVVDMAADGWFVDKLEPYLEPLYPLLHVGQMTTKLLLPQVISSLRENISPGVLRVLELPSLI